MIRYLMVAVLLAGCASTPKEPAIRTVEVKVPIRVACKPPPVAEPSYATATMDLTADIFTLVRGLLVEREQRKAVEVELRGAIASCG